MRTPDPIPHQPHGTGRAKRLDLHTLERLLTFFSAALGEPLTTNDLLEYRP